jgi:hypothetical protein
MAHVTIPLLSLYLYAGSGRSQNSSQVRVTAITKATDNCTLEASPLLKINNTISSAHKMSICSKTKLCNFLCVETLHV